MEPNVPYVVGKYERDIPYYNKPENLVIRLSTPKEGMFYQACEQLANRSFSKAEMTLMKLTSRYPDFKEPFFLLGALKIQNQAWAVAQSFLLPLTGRSYFMGYWIFRFLPDFRLVMQADDDFWLPILPRSEEILVALALIRRNLGDEDACFSITRKAQKKYPQNVGLNILLASQLVKREKYDNVLKLTNERLRGRQDDLALLYRYLRGLALIHKKDHRSGFYQIEGALDLSGNASPYLRENIRFRIIQEFISNRYYIDALEHLKILNSSVATNIPADFDPIKKRHELTEKIRIFSKRGIDVKMSLLSRRKGSGFEPDYWEVGENS